MSKRFRKSLIHIAVVHALVAPLAVVATLSPVYAANASQADATERFAATENLRRTLIELKNAVIASPEDPNLRFRLGRLYLKLGDSGAAEKELTRAAELGLDSYDLRLLLGEAWIQQGDFTKPFTDYDLLQTESASEKAGLLTLQGNARLVQGKLKAAVELFESALGEQPGFAPALIGIVETKLEEGDLAAAELALVNVRASADVDPVDLLRLRANLEFKRDRFDQALTDYRDAIAQRGNDPVLLRGLALTQMRLKQPEQASATLDRLLALNPNNGDAIALKAEVALGLKDYQTAADLAGSVVGVGDDARRLGPLFIAGAASLYNGAPQQASEYLSRYLAQRPDDANARLLLGEAMLRLGDGDGAYAVLKPLADAADPDAPLLLRLALAAEAVGAVDEAVGYLERAVELSPDNERLKAQLAKVRVGTQDRQLGLAALDEIAARDQGYVLFALDAAINRLSYGEFEAAAATAREVQAMAPDAVEPALIQAIALLKVGQLDAAEAGLEQVLEQQPDNLAAKTGMAEIRLRRGDIDQALALFGQLVADRPGDIGARLNLAMAEIQAGRQLKAQQRLERILAENPDSTAARAALANLFIADGLPDQALNLLNDAPDREVPAIVLARARAELIAYRPSQAARQLEQAIARRPTDVALNLALADADERNGQPDLALATIEAVLEVAPEHTQAQFARLRLLLMNPQLPNTELTQALAEAAAYVEKHPDDLSSQTLRGLALRRFSGQGDAGLDILRQVNKAAGSADSAVMLAGSLMQVGRPAEAVEVMDAYVQAHPADNYAQALLARSRLANGDYGAGADDLLAAINRGARQDDLIPLAAWALAVAGRTAEARPYLRQAEAQGAQDPLIRHVKALLLLDGGDAGQALKLLQGLVDELDGAASPRLLLDYAQALAAAGQGQAAQQQLQRALAGGLTASDRAAAEALQGKL